MTTLTWLHISDLHVGLPALDHYWPNVRDDFYKDLFSVIENAGGQLDLVLFTGDMVQRGTPAEFDQATRRLEDLWREFAARFSIAPPLLAIPGNHDLQRPDAEDDTNKVFHKMWNEVRDDFWSNEGSRYRELVRRCFGSYQDWWENLPLPKPQQYTAGKLPGDCAAVLEKEGLRLGVLGLNSSFRQLWKDSREGDMELHVTQFHKPCDGDGPVWVGQQHASLLLTHHPPSWLSESSRRELEGEIDRPGRFAVHLFGHQHEPEHTTVSQGGGTPRNRLQGYSLFGIEPGDVQRQNRIHGYVLGQLTVEQGHRTAELRFWPRRAVHRPGAGWYLTRDEQWSLPSDHPATRPLTIELQQPYASRAPDVSPGLESQPPARRGQSPRDEVLTNLVTPPAEPLSGGEQQARRIYEALAAESDWKVFNITGMAGVGRTQLALRIAHTALSEPAIWRGVIWFSARPTADTAAETDHMERTPSVLDDLGGVLGTVLEDPRLHQARAEEVPALTRELLGEGRHLLVIDDADAAEDQQLVEVIHSLPAGTKVLVITRRPLPSSDFTFVLRPASGYSADPENVLHELEKLSSTEVDLLEALALFPDAVTLSAAAEVAGLPEDSCASSVDRLRNQEILERDPATGGYRIRRHEAQLWALQRLQADPVRYDEASRRAVRHMRTLARTSTKAGGDEDPWSLLAPHIRNLMWAAERSLDLGDWQTTLDFRGPLADPLHQHGRFREAIQLGDFLFTAAEILGDDEQRAWIALYPLARGHLYQGSLRAARRWALRAEALFRQLGKNFGRASACRTLGRVAQKRGRLDEAGQRFREGIEHIRRVGETAHQDVHAHLLSALSALALERRNFSEAERYRNEARDLYRQIADREGLAEILRQEAEAVEGAKPEEAELLLHEALQTNPPRSQRQRATLLLQLGGVLEQLGSHAKAVESYHAAEEAARAAAAADLQARAQEAAGRIVSRP